MYNLNRIHRYYTEGPAEEQTHVIIKRNCYDCQKCKNCELMNKAERCIKTIKKLAKQFIAHKKYAGCQTAIQYNGNDDVIYLNENAADKFKRDIMKAIREAYKLKFDVKVRIIKNASELDDILDECDTKKVIGELAKDMAKRIEDDINGQQAKTNHRAARRILRNRRKKTD